MTRRTPGARSAAARRTVAGPLAVAALLLAAAASAWAQNPPGPGRETSKPSMDLYGWVRLDIGHDFDQIDPNWYDTMRVSKLPSQAEQFGRDSSTFASVRPTRIGLRTSSPTGLGDIKTHVEIDLLGVGADVGQTTFRLRHAWGELGHFGAGQTFSPFMDPNVFPRSLEYWGPTGIASFRNVQVRWMPIQGTSHLTFAIERPGASNDAGVYADRIELQNMKVRLPFPDLSGEYTRGTTWGYARVAGALRVIKWDDMLDDGIDHSGGVACWGLNVSSNVNIGRNDLLRLQLVLGRGIENHMNDAPIDVAIQEDESDPLKRKYGKALPILATVVFLDHAWSARWSSAIGYSRTDISNANGQDPSAYHVGQYVLGNLLYTPVPEMTVGGELQWGRRENFSDGFSSDCVKIQFSFRYSFSYRLPGAS